jgi:hypothetical protein
MFMFITLLSFQSVCPGCGRRKGLISEVKVTSCISIFVMTGDKAIDLLVSPQEQPMAMFHCPNKISRCMK